MNALDGEPLAQTGATRWHSRRAYREILIAIIASLGTLTLPAYAMDDLGVLAVYYCNADELQSAITKSCSESHPELDPEFAVALETWRVRYGAKIAAAAAKCEAVVRGAQGASPEIAEENRKEWDKAKADMIARSQKEAASRDSSFCRHASSYLLGPSDFEERFWSRD